jgi:tetratricopeptide (TPR) repeat protein
MRAIVLLGAVLLLASCEQAPVPQHRPAQAIAPAERLKAEGDALMAAGNYVDAIEKYGEAADLDAAAIGPRFGLGTAYSFLDKRLEAIAQFRWSSSGPTRAPPSTRKRAAGFSASGRSPRPPRWPMRLPVSRPAPPTRASATSSARSSGRR